MEGIQQMNVIITLGDILEISGCIAGIALVVVGWLCGEFSSRKKRKGKKHG
jgi:hypothetical protein